MSLKPIASEKIGKYTLERTLGKGGMGQVYLATDAQLGRPVAIKCILDDQCSESANQRFRKEARILAQLNHPNIIQVYDIVEEQNRLAIVMEYVDGGTLTEIHRESFLTLRQKLVWLAHISEGLSAAHALNIVHRDLKSDNILISRQGTAKISDFGISSDDEKEQEITEGSLFAMSPEQLKRQACDKKSDLFSLGVLAFQLLTGKHPFGDTSNRIQLAERIVSGQRDSLAEAVPSLAEPLVNLIEQCLSCNPNERPSNTEWVAQQFKILSEGSISDEANDETCIVSIEPTAELSSIEPTVELPSNKSEKNVSQSLFSPSRLAILSIIIMVGLSFSYYVLRPIEYRYVAVLPPSITEMNGLTLAQRDNVVNSVYTALQNSVIDMEGYRLIPPKELKDLESDNQTMAEAVGAHESLTSVLHCEEQSCQVIIRRLNIHERSVISQSNWRIIIDKLKPIYTRVYEQSFKLFNYSKALTSLTISEEHYRNYLSLYHKTQIEGVVSHESFQLVSLLQKQIPDFLPLYFLYREIALELFDSSANKDYLENLGQSLAVAEKMFGDNVDILEHYFRLALAGEKLDDAKQLILKLQERSNDESLVMEVKALYFYETGEYRKAKEFFKKAIALRPAQRLYYNLALTSWLDGDPVEAKRQLSNILKQSANDYYGNRLFGNISLSMGMLNEAIASFKRVLLRQNDSLNLNNLGLAYLLNGNYELAKAQFEQSIKLSPESTDSLLNLADAEILLGQHQSAKVHYLDVLKILETEFSVDAFLVKAQVYAHLNENDLAIENLLSAQKLSPNNIEVQYTSALVYSLIGENTSAIAYVKIALEQQYGTVWFRFPWFDSLCSNKEFGLLMEKFNEPKRCSIL